MRTRVLPVIALIMFAIALFVSACGGGDDAPRDSTTLAPVTIKQRDFSFDPSNVSLLGFMDISSGDVDATHQLRIVNEGTVDHTFTIDFLRIDEVVSPGSEVLVDLPADFTSLEFYCRFHESQGMTGRISRIASATPTP